jgi:hypothetical protein
MIEQVREQASALFEQDPALSQENHQVLAQAVNQFWTRQARGDIS